MTRLSVPATSANLGPGFDALGLALSLRNRFAFEEAEGLFVEGCPPEHAGPDNLFVRAFRRGLEELGLPFRGLRLRIESAIPMARGLGSSASLLVGGLLAASRAGLERGLPAAQEGPRAGALPDARLLDLAGELEGHPDNTSPALLGGFAVSVLEGGRVAAVRSALGGRLRFLAMVPPFPLSTAKARAALPAAIPHRDAVFSVGRAALAAAAFALGDTDARSAALASALAAPSGAPGAAEEGRRAAAGLPPRLGADLLHEPYRAPLVPGLSEAMAAAREAGAVAAFLSGAGPTVMAIAEAAEAGRIAAALRPTLASMPGGPWALLELEGDDEGAGAES